MVTIISILLLTSVTEVIAVKSRHHRATKPHLIFYTLHTCIHSWLRHTVLCHISMFPPTVNLHINVVLCCSMELETSLSPSGATAIMMSQHMQNPCGCGDGGASTCCVANTIKVYAVMQYTLFHNGKKWLLLLMHFLYYIFIIILEASQRYEKRVLEKECAVHGSSSLMHLRLAVSWLYCFFPLLGFSHHFA